MLDDGTAVIGITKSLYNLIDAVKAAEGKYCHDKYGYHSDNLQQYTYTFHIKNGISILVDIAAQDGKQVSFKYANGLENGTDFDTKEDFDEYIRNKTYDEKFGSFSFDLSDISSIFDSTSDFFKFMTASIGLMPSIFITVLIAFFTIMLAICVVKWAIK